MANPHDPWSSSPPEPNRRPDPPQRPDLWSRWPRPMILGLGLLLVLSNFAWQHLVYTASGKMFLSVLAGAALGVLLPLAAWSRFLGISWRWDLSLDRPRPLVLLGAGLMGAAALAPTSLLAELSLRLQPADPAWSATLADQMPRTWEAYLLAGLAVVLAAPLVEEILFRGLLHRTASRTWGPVPGAVISSLVFAIIHGQAWYLFGLAGVGLVLAAVYEATGSVTACWVTHGVYNGVSLLLIGAAGQAHADPSPLTAEDAAWVTISLIALIMLGLWLRNLSRPQH